MEDASAKQEGVLVNPSSNGRGKHPKVVVIMGATGSGKSRLAIDLALHFPLEIINADSMQLIDDILSRNRLPVIVGGTNYYIQALVSPFLLDDSVEDKDENGLSDLHGDKSDSEFEPGRENFCYSYDSLKDLDPVAANRIHPNDHRKINQYLSLYARFGVLPSKLLQEKAMENWGRADNFRYHCCFICVDASLPVLDKYVEQRVDRMVDAGLLNEVYDIYNLNADYTRGLRQAIGRRRLNRLNMLFGWNIHYVDATESLQCASDDSWAAHVVEPSAKIIRSYLSVDESLVPDSESRTGTEGLKLFQRDLWTQYVCKACGNRVLRGAHEWEQHKQGRGHRKRICRLRKSGGFSFVE
ncbi:tRNA dimethylallyltransferase 2 [Camellia lanceoleosa]|nr:tRNA dimethylallyltransferase 2 [Camellia lanceoleosa]